MTPLVDESLASRIAALPDPEVTGEWPAERLNVLREAGVFQWGLPVESGGRLFTAAQMIQGYLDLTRACLTTAFILTQRDAACHRLANSSNDALRQKLLPDHCSGRSLATVGISHLSTSRQHWSRPSVVARETPSGYEITGEAPWVTGAAHADLLVTGATLENGQQILAAIPTQRPGITVGTPLVMLALNESCTGSVLLDRVHVSQDEIVAGPAEQVMKVGATGGTGSFTTSAVALGAAARTLAELERDCVARPEFVEIIAALSSQWMDLRSELITAVSSVPSDGVKLAAENLRLRTNSLVSRTAQAYICCAKGAGFVRGHLAERYLRQSMFFQVWSCPPAVTHQRLWELGRDPVMDGSHSGR